MLSRFNTSRSADQGEAATPIATEPPTQSASVKTRFEDGFGSVSAVAGVLAEVASGATRGQLVRERDTEYEALSKFQQIDHQFQRACFKKTTGREMSDNVSDFDAQHDSLIKSLLATAREEGWLITNSSGVPQAQPSRFGLIKVSLVRDWFADGRAPLHAKYARALDDALKRTSEKEAQQIRSNKLTLKTGEIAKVFAFLPGLQKAMSDVNNHQWLLPAMVARGKPRHSSTWCPLEMAEAIAARKGHEPQLRWAFANEPLLLPWRDAWQKKIKDRNAFGR